MTNVISIKGSRTAPRSRQSSMETLVISVDQVSEWRVPGFQRPVRVNAKVLAMAEELKHGEVSLSGVITLGKVAKEPRLWIVDGQHRLEAFKMSGVKEVIADVRIVHFDDMAEMADQFVELNTALVKMRPDDILRGLEPTCVNLQRIRAACPFVGYDKIRRNSSSGPILGISAVATCWHGSGQETPVAHCSGSSVATVIQAFDKESIEQFVRFLNIAMAAWGRDPEYQRFWTKLNLILCMWLWRNLVLDRQRGLKRSVVLDDAMFRKCLMAVSADRTYGEWLQGRNTMERDRSPALRHLKRIFVARLALEGIKGAKLPQPAWSTS